MSLFLTFAWGAARHLDARLSVCMFCSLQAARPLKIAGMEKRTAGFWVQVHSGRLLTRTATYLPSFALAARRPSQFEVESGPPCPAEKVGGERGAADKRVGTSHTGQVLGNQI